MDWNTESMKDTSYVCSRCGTVDELTLSGCVSSIDWNTDSMKDTSQALAFSEPHSREYRITKNPPLKHSTQKNIIKGEGQVENQYTASGTSRASAAVYKVYPPPNHLEENLTQPIKMSLLNRMP